MARVIFCFKGIKQGICASKRYYCTTLVKNIIFGVIISLSAQFFLVLLVFRFDLVDAACNRINIIPAAAKAKMITIVDFEVPVLAGKLIF